MLAVVAGALGAHALQPILNEQQRAWYEKAVFYQFIHSLGLIGIGCSSTTLGQSRTLIASAVIMALGICAFSGTLYLLAVTSLRWVSVVTPVGGVAHIIAWLLLGTAALRAPTNRKGTYPS